MATKTVWILGAGFSASLGGPLLRDLFSKRMELELKAVFEITVDTTNVSRWLAFHLYDYGVSKKIGLRLWRNAEEYLDRLDSAAPPPDSDVRTYKSAAMEVLWEAVDKVSSSEDSALMKFKRDSRGTCGRNEEMNDIRLEAKRWMAAECCAFLKTADPTSERWEPHRNWLASLTADDTVVTFNYDRVIEKLVAEVKDKEFAEKFQILLPHEEAEPKGIPVLKLHGSVDWERYNGRYSRTKEEDFAKRATLDTIAIATPGVHKSSVVNELEPLWSLAEERIREAEIVNFVGYRFPETDAEARRRLLTALRQTKFKGGSGIPTIRTVLGPITSSPETLRLVGLLRGTFPQASVIHPHKIEAIPMYAEDYFTVHCVGKS